MTKYVRVVDGLKSNAGGFDFKIDEVNIAAKWDPTSLNPEEMGGFNFSSEDKILRWLHRGDTLYDVIIPDDAEVIMCDKEKGIYRSNKIIITNPRKITDELVLELYKKNSLSDKILAQVMVTLLWRERVDIVKFIIKDRVNLSNVDEIITEYENYIGNDSFSYNSLHEVGKEIYDILKEIQSPLDISLYIDKEPFIKKITDDKVINLTGQSGSGKSTYAQEKFNSNEYMIIDTDEIFSDNRFTKATGINKELGKYFRKKYTDLPNCGNDFDLIYKEILAYTKKFNKIIVIDCAQFHCVKDIGILKGKLIVIRTCIDKCYERVIERYKKLNPHYTNEDLENYKERKKGIYKWYKYSNKFIEDIDIFVDNKNKHLENLRSRLTNKDFSLLTNNCLAGFIYHDLGLKFLSPTINLRIKPKEFIEFVCNLDFYLKQELVKDNNSDKDFPVGILNGDENHIPITINFDHYSNFTEDKKKWIERSKRINYDNIYIMMEFYDGIHKEELIDLFKKIPYEHKMILTHRKHEQSYTTAINCFYGNLDMNEIGGKIFRYNGLTGKRYYDEFDYVSFLNNK